MQPFSEVTSNIETNDRLEHPDPQSQTKANYAPLLAAASTGNKLALGKLISVFENPRPEYRPVRQQILAQLTQSRHRLKQSAAPGLLLGFTGAPGAGKSSLISSLSQYCLDQDPKLKIAVLAIDPSSPSSGGALLGDRTRMRNQRHQERFFFRSQASQQQLGGVSLNCFSVCRLLRHFFDWVFIETVGIGQNELDIQNLCEHTILVMQPAAGDQIQFIKAGVMEIPDIYVVNKCDNHQAAAASYHLLQTSLYSLSGSTPAKVFRCSANENIGITELASHLLSLQSNKNSAELNQQFFLTWLRHKYGEWGLNIAREAMKTPWLIDSDFEAKQQAFENYLNTILTGNRRAT